MPFSYTVAADVCEGIADCIAVCPEECIHWAEGVTNAKQTNYVYVDAARCTACGACLSVCPLDGAIVDKWKPDLQRPAEISQSYTTFQPAWRTDRVLALARRVFADPLGEHRPMLADALQEAGCADQKLLAWCRQGPTSSGAQWLAKLILG